MSLTVGISNAAREHALNSTPDESRRVVALELAIGGYHGTAEGIIATASKLEEYLRGGAKPEAAE